MEKPKIALYGGGCNPIGLHHQRISEMIWEVLKIPVWIMPCYNHMFDKNSELIESAHRWNMVTEVCAQHSFLTAFDWELVHEHTGSTFDAMEAIAKQYPDYDFHIVIGSDNANIIEAEWHRGDELIDLYPFIIIERPKKPLTVEWPHSTPHRVLRFSYDMSSSKIRKAIADGRFDFVQRHTNPVVWDYIVTGRLYGYRE